jgi:FkbM family methyltransferase
MNFVAGRHTGAFWARLPADMGGLTFCCDLRDALMREVCFTGRYEPQETLLLQQYLGPGMTFVDVGANWGYFTLVAAHLVGAGGRVVSVEADPAAGRSLAANVAKNALEHVSVVAAAASDKPGTVTVHAYDACRDGWSNAGVTLAGSGQNLHGLQVEAKTLDAILDAAGVGRIDLLKMDIEGAEYRALRGLERRLANGAIDRAILELHPSHLQVLGSSVADVVALFESHGYRGWRIDHSAATHRRAAAQLMDPASLVAPLRRGDDFGAWPHLLWVRHGLDTRSAVQAGVACEEDLSEHLRVS